MTRPLFILEERFVLKEAAMSAATSTNLSNAWENFIDIFTDTGSQYNDLDTLHSAFEKQAAVKNDPKEKAEVEKITQKISKATDLGVVKDEVKKFLNIFKKLVDPTNNGATALSVINSERFKDTIGDKFARLNEIVNGMAWGNKARANLQNPNYSAVEERKELVALYNDFVNAVNKSGLLDHSEWWSDFDNQWQAAQEKLQQIAEKLNFFELPPFVDDVGNETGAFDKIDEKLANNLISAIQDLSSKLPANKALIIPNDPTKTQANLKIVADIDLTNFEKALTLILDQLELEDADAKVQASPKNKDWRALFKAASAEKDQAEALKKVWEQYYQDEWQADANKVKSLGRSFISCVTQYGFNQDENPFIPYLKYCFAQNIAVMPISFSAILSAYARGNSTVTKDMLRHKDSLSASGDHNLIYCNQLHSLDITAISKYLDLQRQVLACYTKNLTSLTDGVSFASKYQTTLNDAYNGSPEKAYCLFTGLFDANFSALAKRPTSSADVKTMPLKDLNTCYREFAACFGKEATELSTGKPEITDANIKGLVKGRDRDYMVKLITYYITAYQKDTATNLAGIAASCISSLASLSFNDLSTFSNLFRRFSIKPDKVAETLRNILLAAKVEGIKGFESAK